MNEAVIKVNNNTALGRIPQWNHERIRSDDGEMLVLEHHSELLGDVTDDRSDSLLNSWPDQRGGHRAYSQVNPIYNLQGPGSRQP